MQVENQRVVSLRYIMKNEDGDIMEDSMNAAPVQYVHGAGTILPALESSLSGLKRGERKSISIHNQQLTVTIYFDVLIDDVRQATPEEIERGEPEKPGVNNDCGPDCCC